MKYMGCPVCKEQSVPVGGTECELCDWKKREADNEVVPVSSVAAEKQEEVAGAVEKPKSSKTVKVCAKCGEVKTIVSRGLCGKCRSQEIKAGTLDKNYPARAKKAAAGEGKPLTTKPVVPQKTEKINNKPAKVTPISAVPNKNSSTKNPKTDIPAEQPSGKGLGLSPEVVCQLAISERDDELIETLKNWADDERRDLPNQILYILDKVIANRAKGITL